MFLKLGSTDIVNDLVHSFMLFHMSSSRIDKTNKQTKKIDTVKTSDSSKISTVYQPALPYTQPFQ